MVSLGWINVPELQKTHQGETYDLLDYAQYLVGRVGIPKDIISMVDNSKTSFITGQEFVIDGKMSETMIYHDDDGWRYLINPEHEKTNL